MPVAICPATLNTTLRPLAPQDRQHYVTAYFSICQLKNTATHNALLGDSKPISWQSQCSLVPNSGALPANQAALRCRSCCGDQAGKHGSSDFACSSIDSARSTHPTYQALLSRVLPGSRRNSHSCHSAAPPFALCGVFELGNGMM